MFKNLPTLPGTTPEQTQQIAWAIHYIIETTAGDIAEAMGDEFDNDALLDTACDHMYDYPSLYGRNGHAPLSSDAHKAWLAVDRDVRWAWLREHFRYA